MKEIKSLSFTKFDKSIFNPGKGFTNAWRKIYEICKRTKFLPKLENIKHLDICGFPGAFIFAINHFLATHSKSYNYDWYIQSYKEEGSNFFKDEYGLVKKYPDHFLLKDKGDITKITEINYLDIFLRKINAIL